MTDDTFPEKAVPVSKRPLDRGINREPAALGQTVVPKKVIEQRFV
ncbi:MAG TPA: hypothetical protein VH702_06480 [Vicinamibacterales bacterium]